MKTIFPRKPKAKPTPKPVADEVSVDPAITAQSISLSDDRTIADDEVELFDVDDVDQDEDAW